MKAKVAPSTLLWVLSSLLLQASQATYIRSGCHTNATTANHQDVDVRCLQDDGTDNGGPVMGRNADLINRLIAALLPSINDAIKANVPDPLNIDLAGDISVGSVDIGCSSPVTGGFSYGLGGAWSTKQTGIFSSIVSYLNHSFLIVRSLLTICTVLCCTVLRHHWVE